MSDDWRPTIAWSALTAREVYELVAAAPRVAGPWRRRIKHRNGYSSRATPWGADVVIEDHGGDAISICAWARETPDLSMSDEYDRIREGSVVLQSYATREAADAALRAMGWTLLEDEKEIQG